MSNPIFQSLEERRAVRGHAGAEPSDPPPSSPVSSPRHVGSFRTAWEHFAAAATRISKIGAVLFALFGTLSTGFGIGFAWWTNSQGFVKSEGLVSINESLRRIEANQRAEAETRSGMQARLASVEGTVDMHSQVLLNIPTKTSRRGAQ